LEGRPVQRLSVVLAGHAERLADPAWAGAEEPLVVEPTALAHQVEPLRRLERAKKHRVCLANLRADEVPAPADALRAVDVDVPGPGGPHLVALRSVRRP